MKEYEKLFDKLFEIQEKTIIAMDRMFGKFERIDDDIKDLVKLLEKKADADEKFTRWLKIISGLIALFLALTLKGG